MVFQSLIGILVDWEPTILPAQPINLGTDVSIPDRDFSGLRVVVFITSISTIRFQSLIGILVDWEEDWSIIQSHADRLVSIPDRDFSGLRAPEFISTCVDFSVSIPDRDFSGLRAFNNWIGSSFIRVSIPDRDFSGLRAARAGFPQKVIRKFQSLIGILVDWEIQCLD